MKYNLLIYCLLTLFLFFGCEEDGSQMDNGPKASENQITVPVETMVVTEGIIDQKVNLTGVVKAKNSVDIIAEVSGKIIKVDKNLGDYVKAGQTLAIIDDIIPKSQYDQAKAQVLSTESNLKIAEANLKSDKYLFENKDISELEYDNSFSNFNNAEAQHLASKASLSAAKKAYNDTRIKSPISGIISRKNINLGTMVNIGSPIYRVVDLNYLKLEVSVPQEIINNIRVGGEAKVIISAINNQVFDGFVKRISPQADEITGGFAVEIEVKNDGGIIKAGMTAKIELLISKEKKTLAVPEYSIVIRDNENYVYKIKNNYAELTKVELGEKVGDNVIVLSGLAIEDEIVTVGMKNLGIKTKVNVEKGN